MTSFTVSASLLKRLALLHHACDTDGGALAHINLRLDGGRVRFAATDGKFLAIISGEVTDHSGSDHLNLVLDGVQFATAMKALAKAMRGSVVVTIDPLAKEIRFAVSQTACVVRLVDLVFPAYEGVIGRYLGSAWVPMIATVATRYLSVAAKMIGDVAALMASPVPVGSAWFADQQASAHALTKRDVDSLMGTPGFWTDHELMILIMPISRSTDQRQLDLQGFVALVTVAPKDSVTVAA